MNTKDLFSTLALGAGLIGTAYGLGLKSGWFIDEAGAQVIAQNEVVQQQIKNDLVLLELKRDLKYNQIRLFNNKAEKSALNLDEQEELRILRDDVKSINEAIEKLKHGLGG